MMATPSAAPCGSRSASCSLALGPLIHGLSLIYVLSFVCGANAQNSGGSSNGPNTSLAMIILYAITGCVSALFCVVIVSGAIRAIRHPERYGPRTGEAGLGGAVGQSRARGLTRAILDTFPVVKFAGEPGTGVSPRPKDVENPDAESFEMAETGADMQAWEVVDADAAQEKRKSAGEVGEGDGTVVEEKQADKDVTGEGNESHGAGSSKADMTPAVRPRVRQRRPEGPSSSESSAGVPGDQKEVVPDAIGTETCPICIVDFEEGDDLRVLPCEGHHRFHRECVDQWLLELSSSCPICRQDFHALEAMMAGDSDHLEPPHMPGASRPLSTAAARFSRYLRFARRRQDRHREDGSGYDITDPPMPVFSDLRY